MKKAMVFIDYENFEIARQCLYERTNVPRLDIPALPMKIVERIGGNLELIKTFLFIPKPDETLMRQEWRKKRYDFLKGLENVNNFTVVTGSHRARPKNGRFEDIDIENKNTYYVVEKGTDINVTAHLLTKAFHGSYDTAIVVSGDTDYIPVYDLVNTIGREIIVVGLEGQNMARFKAHTDKQVILDKAFLDDCISTYHSAAKTDAPS